MEFPYRPYQIYQLGPLCLPHVSTCTLFTNGAYDLIDYLMVLALFLLLVVVSLPTIVHLSAILREDRSTSLHPPEPMTVRPRFASVPASSRPTPIRVHTASADRALV